MATNRSADPKQLLHIRIERSLIAKIDRYANKLGGGRSMAVRKIINLWALSQAMSKRSGGTT
jgi:hypothetical protein